MENHIIILFNGYGSSKLWYEYSFEDKPQLRKLDFLSKIKKLGPTYTFNQPFFNVNYYNTPKTKKEQDIWAEIYKKYKPHSSNINFNLEDLDYKTICEKIHGVVKLKYGKNKKYIVIGHSYGGDLALLFSKMYKAECILCCCIDNPPYLLPFYNLYKDEEYRHILLKYKTNADLKKSLSIIKTNSDVKEINKEIDNIYTLTGYRLCQDRIKYCDSKLYVPTIFFRAYKTKPANAHERNFKKYSILEKKAFEHDKLFVKYIMFKDADHFIWKKQEYSDMIISEISKVINELDP
jgi:predicted metal-dependent phosphoesterase TrpH